MEEADVDDCADVTAAHLAGIRRLILRYAGITSLQSGDFAGLTQMLELDLNGNSLAPLQPGVFSGLTALHSLDLTATGQTTLRADVFSDLTELGKLVLDGNDLTSLPAGMFSGIRSLGILDLTGNDLSSFPADVSGLTDLRRLYLGINDLSSLPPDAFSRLTKLFALDLHRNRLSSLPAGVFSGLTNLTWLFLNDNELSSLPAGVFSGLTNLDLLDLRYNNADPLPLTVTVEKVGADKARAKVLAGAPFAVDFTPTVVNGSLPTGVTTLAVAAGSVDGTPVTVTRADGTTEAVTVDVDLTIQPALPAPPLRHRGYEFVRARSGLPVEILPVPPRVTSVAVATTPQSGDTYLLYETIMFTVTFSQPVRVTGHPVLEVGLDNRAGASGSTVGGRVLGPIEERAADRRHPAGLRQPAFAFRIQGAVVRPRRERCADRRQRVAAPLRADSP